MITYFIPTKVCAPWLAAKRGLFSCNDQALLARCLKYIQSVFNLIVDILMDIHGCYIVEPIDSCHMTVS